MGVDNNTKADIDMAITIDRPCTPVESLKQSLKKMKMIREGRLPKNNINNHHYKIQLLYLVMMVIFIY